MSVGSSTVNQGDDEWVCEKITRSSSTGPSAGASGSSGAVSGSTLNDMVSVISRAAGAPGGGP